MAKYVISYDKSIDFSTLQSSLIASGCEVHQVFDSLGVLTIESSNTDFSSIAGVLAYEVASDVVIEEHWHQLRICSRGLPVRSKYVTTNKGLGSVVYLIDSGVDSTHEELNTADIQNLWSWDESFTDTNGHGTGLASILVGSTLGISPDATLKSVKIPFGQSVSISVLLNAFNEILNDHMQTPSIKVVNCSWTVPRSQILDGKITEMQQQGLVIVAAAGNNLQDANTLSPVGLNTVIGVAASDAYDRVISWGSGAGSNWGPDVDITAPGIDVTVANLLGGTVEKSGTSIAAAVVSGVVCQYITDNPTISASVLQDLIIADAIPDILFRNEAIYGTTPNRLVTVPFVELLLTPSKENRIIEVAKNDSLTVPLTFLAPAVSINIHNITIGTLSRTAPEWISLSGNSVVVNPPGSLDTGTYMLLVELLGEDGSSVHVSQLMFKIYDITPSELDTEETYAYYFTSSETGTVVITQSACSGGCTGFGETCTQRGGKNCNCIQFNFCASS